MSDVSTIALLSIVAGVLALDMTEALQVMVSQPLVAASIAGAVVGDVTLGLVVGTALQLVWLGILPVGGAPFPDSAVASVVGVGLAALLERGGASAGWALASGVLVAIATGALGGRVVGLLRRLNVRLSDLALSRAERGDPSGVRSAVLLGLSCRLASAAALTALVLAASCAVLGRVHGLASGGQFPTAVWAAPIAAVGILLRGRGRLELLLLSAGFAVGIARALLR
jgi:mannose/fructose/N-acetylgalactosamine-specific phosphotransferase system component IIC